MITAHQLACRYVGHDGDALAGVTIEVPPGGLTLLAGPTGSGKSTLANLLCGVIPHLVPAAVRGQATVAGRDPCRSSVSEMSHTVGLLLQNVECQVFCDDAEDEVAFGLENRGVDPADMPALIDTALRCVGADRLRGRRLGTLSAGERQRVVLAALLAAGQPVLILDEPLAYLDRSGTRSLLATLAELGRQGRTVLVLEHRRDLVRRLAARELFLDHGRLADAPPATEAFSGLIGGPLGQTRLAWQRLTLAWDRRQPALLTEVSASVRAGESLVLVGDNGSGKTTLMRAALGLVRPRAGSVMTCGHHAATTPTRQLAAEAALVLQSPDHQLQLPTVAEEVGGQLDELSRLGLAGLAGRHPQSLSLGQKRRLTLAAALARRPKLLLLDEPTVGQDDGSLALVLRRLIEFVADGGALVTATHDRRAALALAQRALILEGGSARHASRRDLELFFDDYGGDR
jgi:energy-coupling factor transport system ATP-binding protein